MKLETAAHGAWICWKPSPNGCMVNDPLSFCVYVPWTQFMTPVMHCGYDPISGRLSVGGYRRPWAQILTIGTHTVSCNLIMPVSSAKIIQSWSLFEGEQVYAQRI